MFPYPNSRKHVVDQCPSIQILWLMLWTSPSKCPGLFLWINIYPSTMLIARMQMQILHLASQILCVRGNQHLSRLYPNYMFVVLNSMLLRADAHVNSVVLVEFHDHYYESISMLLWASTHPITISVDVDRPIQMQGVFLWVSNYASTILAPEDAMPMQVLHLLL